MSSNVQPPPAVTEPVTTPSPPAPPPVTEPTATVTVTSNVYVSPSDLYVAMVGGSQRANPWVGFLQTDDVLTGNIHAEIIQGWESPYELAAYEILTDYPEPTSNTSTLYVNRGNNSSVIV
jgi:hypothetical protein